MTKPVVLGWLLGLGALLVALAGLGLLVDPLGMACWFARNTPMAPASIGVAWAYLAYHVLTCLTLAWATVALGRGPRPALAAALLHGLFGVALLATLLRRDPDSAWP